MDERLMAAAWAGDIDILYKLIRESPYLLEFIDFIPFVDTPLHVAASAGQVNFAMEIMRLKPSFARKLNQDGFSPMHLALQNEQTLMVLRLIDIDSDLVRVKGREGITPLHYVAEKGILHLLAEFLSRCPESIEDETIRKETALHIALKSDMVEAFQVLIGWLRSFCHEKASYWEEKVLKVKDNEGNTLLHIATSRIQPQSVRLLLDCGVDVNTKNLAGLTALDILYQSHQLDNREIKNMLLHTGALRASSLPSDCIPTEHLRSKMSFIRRIKVLCYRAKREITNDLRSLLLVIAVLVATATYQAILNPPGGVLQASYNPGNDGVNTTSNTTMLSDASPPQPPAGTAVMKLSFFGYFTFLNSMSFLTTLLVIFFLIPSCPHGLSKHITSFCLVPLYSLFGCYIISLTFIAPSSFRFYVFLEVFEFCVLMLLLFAFAVWVESRTRVKAIVTRLLRRNDNC